MGRMKDLHIQKYYAESFTDEFLQESEVEVMSTSWGGPRDLAPPDAVGVAPYPPSLCPVEAGGDELPADPSGK